MFAQKSFFMQSRPQRTERKHMWLHVKQYLFQGIVGLSLVLIGASPALASNVIVTFDTPMTFNSPPITLPNFTEDPSYDPLVLDANSFNPVIFGPNFLTTEGFAFSPQIVGLDPHFLLIDDPNDVPCTANASTPMLGGCVDNGSNYLLEEAGPGDPFALGVPIIMTHSSGRPFSLLEFDASQVFLDDQEATNAGIPNADQINLEGELFDGTTMQLSFLLQDATLGFSTFSLPPSWVNLKSVTFSGSVLNQNGEPIGTGAIGIDDLSALSDVLITDRDSFISGWWRIRNLNEGANSSLVVRWLGKRRAVVGFDINGISKEGLEKVTLVLNIKGRTKYWGRRGRMVDLYNLNQSFTEGNGANSGKPWRHRERGDGAGVTWNCATDTDISNRKSDCDQFWKGGSEEAAPIPTDSVKHKNGMTGEVRFDVTLDVLDKLDQGNTTIQWLVRKANERRFGLVAYYSKEGAVEDGDLMKAPRLELEYAD